MADDLIDFKDELKNIFPISFEEAYKVFFNFSIIGMC